MVGDRPEGCSSSQWQRPFGVIMNESVSEGELEWACVAFDSTGGHENMRRRSPVPHHRTSIHLRETLATPMSVFQDHLRLDCPRNHGELIEHGESGRSALDHREQDGFGVTLHLRIQPVLQSPHTALRR